MKRDNDPLMIEWTELSTKRITEGLTEAQQARYREVDQQLREAGKLPALAQ